MAPLSAEFDPLYPAYHTTPIMCSVLNPASIEYTVHGGYRFGLATLEPFRTGIYCC
jgi:hypothetical protein